MDPADFQWEEGTPIYTDGTAIHASFPEVSQAVAGAVQITSRGTIKVVIFVLDHTWPRTAVVSEHIALILATMFATVPMTIVTDCQAVYNLAKHTHTQETDGLQKQDGRVYGPGRL